MGVQNLWRILNVCGRLVQLESLSNRRLAIDLSIWLNNFIKAMRDSDGAMVRNAHLRGLFSRICKLLFFGVRPAFVFDGATPTIKKRTTALRRNKRQEAARQTQFLAEMIVLNQLRQEAVNQIRRAYDAPQSEILAIEQSQTNNTQRATEIIDLSDIGDDENDYKDLFDEEPQQPALSKEYLQEVLNALKVEEDIAKIDLDGEDFASLPEDVKLEVINYVKQLKMSQNRQLMHDLAKSSSTTPASFSQLQMQHFITRGKLTYKLNELKTTLDQGPKPIASSSKATYVFNVDSNSSSLFERSSDEKSISVIRSSNQRRILDPETAALYERIGWLEDGDDIAVDSEESSEDIDDNDEDVALLEQSPVKRRKLTEPSVQLEQQPQKSEVISDDSFEDIEFEEQENEEEEDDGDGHIEIELDDSVENDVIEGQLLNELFRKSLQAVKSQPAKVTPPVVIEIDSEDESKSTKDDIVRSIPKSVDTKKQYGSINDDRKKLKPETSNKTEKTEPSGELSMPKEMKEASGDVALNIEMFADAPEDELLYDDKHTSENVIDSVGSAHEKTQPDVKPTSSQPNQPKSSPVPQQSIAVEVHPVAEVSGTSSEVKEAIASHAQDMVVIEDEDIQDASILLPQVVDTYEHELQLERTALVDFHNREASRAQTVTSEMVEECKELLQLFGIPYVVSPTEADAQCAVLEMLGLVDGIVSDDSDIFLFGGRTVFKNAFKKDQYLELYEMKDIETELGFTRTELISLALLLGSDYTDGVKGVGPKIAVDIVKTFKGPDGMQRFREWVQSGKEELDTEEAKAFYKKYAKLREKLSLEELFPNKEVINAYLQPLVDNSTEEFQWSCPDLDALRGFAESKFGWDRNYTDTKLLPVIQRYNRALDTVKSKQAKITTYFVPLASSKAPSASSKSTTTASTKSKKRKR